MSHNDHTHHNHNGSQLLIILVKLTIASARMHILSRKRMTRFNSAVSRTVPQTHGQSPQEPARCHLRRMQSGGVNQLLCWASTAAAWRSRAELPTVCVLTSRMLQGQIAVYLPTGSPPSGGSARTNSKIHAGTCRKSVPVAKG